MDPQIKPIRTLNFSPLSVSFVNEVPPPIVITKNRQRVKVDVNLGSSVKEFVMLELLESVVNIFKYRFPDENTSKYASFNKSATEGGEPPFQVVFTNRQAQALLFYANQINNLVE